MLIDIWQTISPFILPVYYLCILGIVVSVILENRNPLKTHSYLLLLLLLPILGIIIYFFFGQNFRKRKIFSKSQLINSAFGQNYLENFQSNTSAIHLPDDLPNNFKKLTSFLNKDLSPFTLNNHAEVLINGEEKFPRLLEALKSAKSHIHIEYYIFSDDDIGRQVLEILIEKAKEGVEVKFIVDGVGSLHLKRKFLNQMKESGIEVHRFMPVLFPKLTSTINYRNHRKIVVVDGIFGFTGGINLDDRYLNNGKHSLYWRDTHLYLEGEAVKSLQFLFLLNWQFVCKVDLKADKKYFPTIASKGNKNIQINASGPDWELSSIMDSFFLAINAAQHSLKIATPYFIPNESILNAILTVSKSGVAVELMLPYESDSWITQAASESFLSELLKNGIRVFLYKKGFLHAKTLVVDDYFSSIGTANMDYRSFDLNHEVNTYIYDAQIARVLIEQFNNDKKECIELQFEQWKHRKISRKLVESVCRLLAPLL